MIVRLLLLVVLIGSTVALSDWLRDLQKEFQPASSASPAGVPDYAFQEVKLTVMGMGGEPRYRIEAPRMAHFLLNDSAKVTSPEVWFYRDKGPAVELRSELARIAADGRRIWLLGEVEIVSPPYAGRAPFIVHTRNVTAFPASQRAHTEAPVAAVSGDERLQGVGMVLDLAAGTLDLKSRVRGTYVP